MYVYGFAPVAGTSSVIMSAPPSSTPPVAERDAVPPSGDDEIVNDPPGKVLPSNARVTSGGHAASAASADVSAAKSADASIAATLSPNEEHDETYTTQAAAAAPHEVAIAQRSKRR